MRTLRGNLEWKKRKYPMEPKSQGGVSHRYSSKAVAKSPTRYLSRLAFEVSPQEQSSRNLLLLISALLSSQFSSLTRITAT